MGDLTLGVFPSLVGSMSLDFSFKLAEAAIAKGHKVNMWLSGNAVMMAKKGQKAFKDYSYNDKRMKELSAKAWRSPHARPVPRPGATTRKTRPRA
jgi:tRNA 2-thiouridine synthesizing protein D